MKTITVAVLLFFVCHVAYAQKPVDDSQLNELVIIGEPGNAIEQMFDTNAALKGVRSKCLYTPLRLTDRLYQLRYASSITGTPPMVLFQRQGGGVIWAADAQSMPYGAEAVYAAMKAAYEKTKLADGSNKQYLPELDCPNDICPLPNQFDKPELNFNPFNFRKPADIMENWLTSTIRWTIFMVGLAIAFSVFVLFAIIILGVVLMFNRR